MKLCVENKNCYTFDGYECEPKFCETTIEENNSIYGAADFIDVPCTDDARISQGKLSFQDRKASGNQFIVIQ